MRSLDIQTARRIPAAAIEPGTLPLADARARWPARLRELAGLVRRTGEGGDEAALEEFWRLLNLALHGYVRRHVRRFGPLSADDAFDLTADKGLDLVARLRRGSWDPGAGTEEQMCAFLSSVARHGVIDFIRRQRRESAGPAREPMTDELIPFGRAIVADAAQALTTEVESALDGRRYARALLECVQTLTARARLAWYLRVFGDCTAARIARHSGILTSPAGVDLILNRSRRQLRKCLASRGLQASPIPPGTFVALWERIDAEQRRKGGAA